ncbi:MAG: 5-(carboxyamino)imidazole ribonucleotide mutase [Hallerella porci]|uniref:N5-carboxyaminoimidazole ribonucleotide mutase n=1 Tax=Hallerella porci TaxID=1945871 RepID=A0ABX5LHI9_9BACT|nr:MULTISPECIES: 5-(carboxyamino)imidazole ribonucleotide mutase [Hallerella]MCI5600013.1 5-(carboxyamino)imidazole ribonucleotide mutase [Hallerella sp.]MDY3922254.1 5-(carboxyamino)imidazole ribonucleotide mutase [Hallerella porci]PWK89638.1 5-(carboxyamino)imidazole ribonucleotide mutase [Hallerella porci]
MQEVKNPLVGIVTGSASDKPIVDKVTSILDEFGVAWEYNVLSAHRTPNKTAKYAREAEGRGVQVLVGIAGLAAALPGTLAAHTTLPVIGVPGDGGPLSGVDALHSIVQMPSGIPVATVGIGNGKNAAYLAIAILALSHADIRQKLADYRKSLGDI